MPPPPRPNHAPSPSNSNRSAPSPSNHAPSPSNHAPSPSKGEGWGGGAPAPPAASSGAAAPDNPTLHQGTGDGTVQANEWTVERARAYLAGMDPQIADLFPDRLVDSELGEIPEGWEVRPLDEAAHITYGAPFASRRFNSDGFGTPLIRIRDLATHSPSVFTEETHPKGQIIQPGDIVAGMDGEFRVHIWRGPSSWLNQRLCRFEPLPRVPRLFLFESLIAPLADVERSKVGTTVIHLGKSDIDTFTLLMPTQSILDQFSYLTELIVEQFVGNASQSLVLAAQRDALLPQLMSGEVGVEKVHLK